ncbi:MAG: DJ-1/PfpI family protein [Halobacteria archaeon]
MNLLTYCTDGVSDLDLTYCLSKFEESTHVDSCEVVSEKDKVESDVRETYTVDSGLGEIQVENYHGLFLPHHSEVDSYPDKIGEFSDELLSDGGILGCRGNGVEVLRTTGDLTDRQVSISPDYLKEREQTIGQGIEGEVVVDGKLVTAYNPEDLPDLVKELDRKFRRVIVKD